MILTENLNLISPQQAKDKKLFGPVYHGTTSDKLEKINTYGFKTFIDDDGIGDVSNGYQISDYWGGIPAPVHHLGFGTYFTTNKSIAKRFSHGNPNIGPYFLDVSRLEIINWGSNKTMMKWWIENGYNYNKTSETTFGNNKTDLFAIRKERMRATLHMTEYLKSKYDGIWYKGKGLYKLLDGDQVVIFDQKNIYKIDKSLIKSGEIGSKVIAKIGIDPYNRGKITIPIGTKGIIVDKQKTTEFQKWTEGSEYIYKIKWEKGGIMYNVVEDWFDFYEPKRKKLKEHIIQRRSFWKDYEKIFNENLLEVNISDKSTLNQHIIKLLVNKGVLNNQNILKWFAGPFVKWFISPEDDETKRNSVEKHIYRDGEPEYLKHGDMFDFKGFSPDQIGKLNHIIDYFLSLPENDQRKLPTTSFSQISKRIQEWDLLMIQRMKSAEFGRYKLKNNIEGKDIKTIYKFNDGYRFVQLLSQESREEEGRIMGHCIGGENYNENNLSLRDPNGFPHVTIEFDRNKIHQIKGKQNKTPVPKYIPYIKKFIIDNNFNVLADGKNIGMVEWKDRFYWKDSQIFQDIYKNKIIPERETRFNEIKSRIKNGVIEGLVDVSGLLLTQLPDFLNGLIVIGDFFCSNNNLTSLQGAPREVVGDFYCSNNNLTSLQGSPKEVGRSFYCSNNNLTSLQGSPKKVGRSFFCPNNNLTSLQGSPREVGGCFFCSDNNLTSLDGSPKIVGGFYCSDNNLTSLDGSPKIVGSFYCSDNNLTSLDGAPEIVNGDFYCEGNPLESLDGKPEFIKGDFWAPEDIIQENIKKNDKPVKFNMGISKLEENFIYMYLLKNLRSILEIPHLHLKNLKKVKHKYNQPSFIKGITEDVIEYELKHTEFYTFRILIRHKKPWELNFLIYDPSVPEDDENCIIHDWEKIKEIDLPSFLNPKSITESNNPRLGKCYELSGRYVSKHPKTILVHGKIHNPYVDQNKYLPSVDHAWVEEKDGKIFDPVMDIHWEKDAFERIYKPVVYKKYNFQDTLIHMLRYEHWGPWHDEEPPKKRITENTTQESNVYFHVSFEKNVSKIKKHGIGFGPQFKPTWAGSSDQDIREVHGVFVFTNWYDAAGWAYHTNWHLPERGKPVIIKFKTDDTDFVSDTHWQSSSGIGKWLVKQSSVDPDEIIEIAPFGKDDMTLEIANKMRELQSKKNKLNENTEKHYPISKDEESRVLMYILKYWKQKFEEYNRNDLVQKLCKTIKKIKIDKNGDIIYKANIPWNLGQKIDNVSFIISKTDEGVGYQIEDSYNNFYYDLVIPSDKSNPPRNEVYIKGNWKENDGDHADALSKTGYWGRQGAGAIILAQDTGRILLPYRSNYVEQPHTWGVWGGAIDAKEEPATAVKREIQEEVGYNDPNINLIPMYIFKDERVGFKYFNFLAVVPKEFTPKINWETENFQWVKFGEWPSPLHFGLKSLIENSKTEIYNEVKKYDNTLQKNDEWQKWVKAKYDAAMDVIKQTWNEMYKLEGKLDPITQFSLHQFRNYVLNYPHTSNLLDRYGKQFYPNDEEAGYTFLNDIDKILPELEKKYYIRKSKKVDKNDPLFFLKKIVKGKSWEAAKKNLIDNSLSGRTFSFHQNKMVDDESAEEAFKRMYLNAMGETIYDASKYTDLPRLSDIEMSSGRNSEIDTLIIYNAPRGMKKFPDKVKVYRGTISIHSKIRPGDFCTLNSDTARSYIRGKHGAVVSDILPSKDLIVFRLDPINNELIYWPEGHQIQKYTGKVPTFAEFYSQFK